MVSAVPLRLIVPVFGFSVLAKTLKKVVLPAPFNPTMPCTRLGSKSILIFFKTSWSLNKPHCQVHYVNHVNKVLNFSLPYKNKQLKE